MLLASPPYSERRLPSHLHDTQRPLWTYGNVALLASSLLSLVSIYTCMLKPQGSLSCPSRVIHLTWLLVGLELALYTLLAVHQAPGIHPSLPLHSPSLHLGFLTQCVQRGQGEWGEVCINYIFNVYPGG